MIEGDLIGGLADIEEQLRSGNANHATLAAQLAQILQALTNMPAAQVTVQPAAVNVQPANVTVQPADVVIMPAVETPRGWKLTVTARDENGSIRTLSLKPE